MHRSAYGLDGAFFTSKEKVTHYPFPYKLPNDPCGLGSLLWSIGSYFLGYFTYRLEEDGAVKKMEWLECSVVLWFAR